MRRRCSGARAFGGLAVLGPASLVLIGASPAFAAPTARLVYSRGAGAETCPDEGALRQAVARRVGYDAFFPYAARTIVVRLLRRDEAFAATVRLVDEDGVDHGEHALHTARSGNGSTCAELLDAAAFAVVVAIDPRLLTAPSPDATSAPSADGSSPATDPSVAPPPEPRPPAPPPSPPVTTPPTDPRPADGDRAPAIGTSSPRFAVLEASAGAAAWAGIGPGTGPGLTFGGTLGIAARGRWFSLGVEGLVTAPSAKTAQDGGRVSTWAVLGALVPCLVAGPLMACGELQSGALESSGTGVSGAHGAASQWWAVGGRIGAELTVTEAMRIRGHVDLLVDLSPSSLKLNGDTVWQAPPLAGLLGIDGVLHFR